MALVPGMESINWYPIIGNIIYWTGYGLLAILILVGFWFAAQFTQYKIKALIFPLYGSGKDGIFSIGKPKKNRIRWINSRTAWKSWYPLMNRKEREPFDTEFIYPGSLVYIFELNDEWLPGRINIKETENEIRGEINPVPYYVRNWQSLTHKKIAQQFAKKGFWEENKTIIMTIAVVAICCILCGATIYFTFKFATGSSGQISALTTAINNIGNIGGSQGTLVPN